MKKKFFSQFTKLSDMHASLKEQNKEFKEKEIRFYLLGD
jgi:hypothetical protein